MEQKIRELEEGMQSVSKEDMEAYMENYHKLLHEFEARDGYSYRSEVSGVLKGLGFSEDDFEKHCNELSGGQKQRISLARAILKDPSIIILDDTTSAIDMETESMIQNELKKISDERTVFIIAHRISSIIHADQILVLDNGRLVERGTHEQLLAKKGYYSTVFHHQYGEFDRFKKVRAEKGRGEA